MGAVGALLTTGDLILRVVSSTPNRDQLIILEDFNARVGAEHNSWPLRLGKFGVGKMNENDQRLLELCTFYNLCITYSYFKTKQTRCHGGIHAQNTSINATSS